MFERNFVGVKDFRFKQDKLASFRQFLKEAHLDEGSYPYSHESENKHKGKPIVFTATGWGGYFNADNQWVLFIAYRSPHPDHTIQHCWSWDAENSQPYNHRTMEFIN